MKLQELESSIYEYEASLYRFTETYELPEKWFNVPDHFAIKTANESDYVETCAELAGVVDHEGIWEIHLDGRRLASAKLLSKVVIAGHEFDWVEIMQPRPGKELEHGFIEHLEFVQPDFYELERILDNIPYEHQTNEGYAWLNIEIDSKPRELKFNDKSLAEVVIAEREQGKLHRIPGI